MNKKWIAGVALMTALAVPAVSLGHGGHTHKVMGTVSAMTDKQIEVKTTDGKTVVIALGAKTVYQQGKAKVDTKALKIGVRVVVEAEGADGAKTMTAKTVQVAVAPAAAANAASTQAR
jgi:hypothetical protein